MVKRRFVQAEQKNGRTVLYFRRGKGDRIRLPDDPSSSDFLKAYEQAFAGEDVTYRPSSPETISGKRIKEVERCARIAVGKARMRAIGKAIDFDLSSEWAIQQVRSTGYKCPVSGIDFLEETASMSFMRPFAPSVDRVDCKKGYTQGNCRVVIFAVNAMMADWGEEIFNKVARGYLYQRNKSRRSKPLNSIPLPLNNDFQE